MDRLGHEDEILAIDSSKSRQTLSSSSKSLVSSGGLNKWRLISSAILSRSIRQSQAEIGGADPGNLAIPIPCGVLGGGGAEFDPRSSLM